MRWLRTWCDEWRTWWREAGASARWSPLAIAAGFLALHVALGGFRLDHAWIAAGALAFYYAGPRLRPAATFLLPLLVMIVVYDAQQYWAGAWRAPVRVAEPHAFDIRWFGIHEGGQVVTPSTWWQTRTFAVLDLVCGAAYLAFVPVFLLTAAWWCFVRKIPGARRVMWAMLWLNVAAYAIWMIYPAAPPWYADHYGLGPAVLNAAPEAAGAARFDALLGVTWFADYYGRNANVFGAIPSLHVGQTFLAVLFAWRFRSLRVFTTLFWALVAFSSVYLNHHYVLDGLAGMALATLAWWAARTKRGEATPTDAAATSAVLITAASQSYWRCLYQFLLSVERQGRRCWRETVVWDLGLGCETRARLETRFPWARFERLDFSQMPGHARPDRATYAWKPVVIHRTMQRFGGRLVWLDSAALLHGGFGELSRSLEARGVYALTGQSALRLRCDEAVQAKLGVPRDVLEQPEFAAGVLGFDTGRAEVAELIDEWRLLAMEPESCPPRHAGHNPEQALFTIVLRRRLATGTLSVDHGEIDISSPHPVRWTSSRNKVPNWLPLWADPLARAWYAVYKFADRRVLRAKAARSKA